MHCRACGFESLEGLSFCGRCGSPLAQPCPQCNAQNPTGFAFCGTCGASLTERLQAGVVARQPEPNGGARPDADDGAARREAERRQVTVLFCDVVGSTELSGRLDPEDLREVMRAYQAAAAEVINAYDGHIAQYLGDGLLVYFGYPRAHEDDAARAVRTALKVIQQVERLSAQLQEWCDPALSVRIGVHTGLAVVGAMGSGGRQEHLAVGETPNLAARLQGLAEPGTVVISGATYRLVQGLFELRDLGTQTVKGFAGPVTAYQVVEERPIRSRLELAAASELTTLVGRDHEVGLMLDRWERSKEGAGQVLLLSGEPGIGKSRLTQVLKDRGDSQARNFLECRCSPYYANTALHPVSKLLQLRIGFTSGAMVQTLTEWRDGGSEALRPYFLSLLAEAYEVAGQPEPGLEALDEAIADAEHGGECWWEAELYRLQGSLLLLLPDPDQAKAETCFRQALEIARKQQARSLELRAAVSLGRLWQQQGKHARCSSLSTSGSQKGSRRLI